MATTYIMPLKFIARFTDEGKYSCSPTPKLPRN